MRRGISAAEMPDSAAFPKAEPMRFQLQWHPEAIAQAKDSGPNSLTPSGFPHTTGTRAGALTVAGQWRIRTAFPNVLALVVMSLASARRRSYACHESDFHGMNFYSLGGSRTSKVLAFWAGFKEFLLPKRKREKW